MNYHNKRFRVVSNSENGELSSGLIFHYQQQGNILTCTYRDVGILQGQILGWVDEAGNIDMRYQQINSEGEIMTGLCNSRPEPMENDLLRLHESWQWTSGDRSTGTSILEEIET